MPSRCSRSRVPLGLLALLAAAGCSWLNRGGPTGIFIDDGFGLAAPVLSYGITDAETNCAPGEDEEDALVTWGRQQFTPTPASVLYQVKLSTCREPGEKRRFVPGTPAAILEDGDAIGSCTWEGFFEFAQVGRYTVAVGQCVGGDNAVVVGEWDAGTVSFDLGFRTGLSFSDSSTFQTATGFDAVWDGADLRIGLTYRDSLDRFGLALCTDPGTGWACERAALAGDLGQAYLTGPKLGLDCPGASEPGEGCPSPAPIDACVLSSGTVFGQATALWRLPVRPSVGMASRIVGVGDDAPGIGEEVTGLGFGGFVDHAAGNRIGAVVLRTSPSNINALYTYGASGLASSPVLQTGDAVPDTLGIASTFARPSFDRDRLSFRVGLGLGVAAYLTETDDAQMDRELVGFLRTDVDMWEDREIEFATGSNHAVSRGTAVLGLDLTSSGGPETGVVALDVERVEIVRGGATSIYGANATAGVIRILTAEGFDLEGPFAPGLDFQGAAFSRLGDLWLLEGDGDLHEWDFGLQTASFLGSTGLSGATGLGFDAAGNPFAATATDLYSIDTSTYGATMVGSFEDDLGTPVTDISGLSGGAGGLGAVSLGGLFYEVDTVNASLTPRAMVSGLPSTVHSIANDGERFFGGLSDGRVVEAVDWSMHAGGGASGGAPEGGAGAGANMPPAIGFGVLGDPDNGPVTALAVMTPEPAGAAAAATALATLACLARARRRRESA